MVAFILDRIIPRELLLLLFEGFSVINGNFESGNFNYVTAFTLPMKIIKGDAIIAISGVTAAPVKDIDIPNLTEVGGSLAIQQIPKAAAKCSFW